MIPRARFFGIPVSRLVLGDNPFTGHSYIPDTHSGDEMMDFYTAEKCVQTLFEAEAQGINMFVALGEPFILRVIRQYRNEGGTMNLLFQSYPAIALEANLRMMEKCEPLAIYHQGSTADYLCETGQVNQLRTRLQTIKATGLPTGLGTHVPETVLRAEEEDWGVDFYMTCLYNARRTQRGQESGFITGRPKQLVFYPEDRFLMYPVIQQVAKPCIAFKIFAGGQVFAGRSSEAIPDVAEAMLKETYANIKPDDLACVGVFQKYTNQVQQLADCVRKLLP